MRPSRFFRKVQRNFDAFHNQSPTQRPRGNRVGRSLQDVSGFFSRLLLVAAFSVTLAGHASAETMAETAKQWGLIGPWSLDCMLPPDHNKGTVLTYDIADDHVVHRRDFGDARDEAEVLSLSVSADGMIHLRVYFPSVKQTREYGMIHQDDGTVRAMYNRNEKNQYSIKDGKYTSTGKPTPAQHKCERTISWAPHFSPASAQLASRRATP